MYTFASSFLGLPQLNQGFWRNWISAQADAGKRGSAEYRFVNKANIVVFDQFCWGNWSSFLKAELMLDHSELILYSGANMSIGNLDQIFQPTSVGS